MVERSFGQHYEFEHIPDLLFTELHLSPVTGYSCDFLNGVFGFLGTIQDYGTEYGDDPAVFADEFRTHLLSLKTYSEYLKNRVALFIQHHPSEDAHMYMFELSSLPEVSVINRLIEELRSMNFESYDTFDWDQYLSRVIQIEHIVYGPDSDRVSRLFNSE